MSKVLIGIGAAIVLAGVVFAIVHFTAGPKQQVEVTQNGWMAVVNPAHAERGPMHVVGTFGAWRLLCRNSQASVGPANGQPPSNASGTPGSNRCVVVIVMRRSGAQKEMLNFRLSSFPIAPGLSASFAALAYMSPNTGQPYSPPRGSKGKEVDLMADQHTVMLYTRHCGKGGCIAVGRLSPPELASVLAAHHLTLELAPGEPGAANEAAVPTDGLKAAFAALHRQEG